MKRILFVDDESHVLDGLRRMLHSYRSEWRMTFASSGAEALRSLAALPCDVIVTDMRMPGISGAELLVQVSLQYPHIIRIVLSGMCDREQALSAAVLAHQFLAKPCDAAILKKVVDGAASVHATIENTGLKSFISRLKSLPSMPAVYTELVDAARDPNVSVARLGAIVSKDVAMTSKVLHLVSSSLFGIRRAVLAPAEACVYLGVDTIQALVLSLGVFSQYRGTGPFSVEQLQTHSLRTATLAKELAMAEHFSKSAVGEAFLAGLLHGIGKLGLAINCTRDYDKCLSLAAAGNFAIVDVELSTFGITHADAGMYLLRLWGLPDSIVEAVSLHHQPSGSSASSPAPLTMVHAADVLTREEENWPRSNFDTEYLSRVGLHSRIAHWRTLSR